MNRTAPEPTPTQTITVHGRRVAATVAIATALTAGYAAGASGATIDPDTITVAEQIDAGGVWGGGWGELNTVVRVPGGGILGIQ